MASIRGSRACGRALATALAASAMPLAAQQPAPSPSQPTVLPPYRAPTIALVQPQNGGAVPQDKPVVVFRFAAGEPADPIDARSFRVAVDGEDRTALFQVSAGEAWGPLAMASAGRPDDAVAAGAHTLAARVCSSRGACASTTATVTALPAAAVATPAPAPSAKRRARVIDVLLSAVRKLLMP